MMDAKSPAVLIVFAKSNPALVENNKSLFYHLNEQELSAAKCLQVLSIHWIKAAIQRLIDSVAVEKLKIHQSKYSMA